MTTDLGLSNGGQLSSRGSYSSAAVRRKKAGECVSEERREGHAAKGEERAREGGGRGASRAWGSSRRARIQSTSESTRVASARRQKKELSLASIVLPRRGAKKRERE